MSRERKKGEQWKDSRRSHYYFRINEMGNMSEKKVSLFACPPNPSHYAYNRGSQRSETMPLLLCWRMVIFQGRTRRDTKSMTVSE